MAGPVRIGGVTPGSVAGAAEWQKLLDSFPREVIDSSRRALEAGAERMVETIKAHAPVSELEAHPGELRDSVHKEDGRHDLSVLVVEDAGEAEGRGYSRFVEFGHRAQGGGHVAPHPHFWPAVRGERGKIRNQIAADMRRAAKGQS